ncbi:ATP-binding protein [Flavihumibacter rivuli]|uniref:ligand-binding sensor domain-containing protein n=1 Tax=Flavihumibacter rivuli TaxID=2838156 RepID=UPI001EFA60D6|nr:sensor histidine kinase [Flavihumibacter rivuli]ULQ57699.1 ATP-binding protein [Flavihumibacter rivuli]
MHYTTGNGLASNFVYNVTQDKKGYIWLATVNGLQRFDGEKFITFRHSRNRPSSIPFNNVAVVYADRKDRVWLINEDNSVGIFNASQFAYQRVAINMPARSMNVYAPARLMEDWDGRLILFIAGQAPFMLNERTFVFEPAGQSIPYPKGWFFYDFTCDSASRTYWFGADSGLAVYNTRTRHLNYPGNNPDRNPVIESFAGHKRIGAIEAQSGKGYFACSSWPLNSAWPYAHWYELASGKHSQIMINNQIDGVYTEIHGWFTQKSGKKWIYGLPFIAEFDPSHTSMNFLAPSPADNNQLRFDNAHHLFEDKQQNLWLSTSNGIFVFNPDLQPFTTYHLVRPGRKQFIDKSITSVTRVMNNQVWVGSWGKGLYCYDLQFNPIMPPAALAPWYDAMTIWSIHEHSRTKKIWIGEQTGYMKVYDPSTQKATSLFLPIFEQRTIRQIAEDREGNLWLGTQGGLLVKWDLKASGGDHRKGYSVVHRLGLIHKINVDPDGSLWVATLGKGIYHIDPATGRILDHIMSSQGSGKWRLGNDSPTDILRYNDSILIVANTSITKLNTKRKTSTIITTDDGLPTNTAYYLQKDEQGRVWIALQNGLCRWNLDKNNFTLFDKRDGITDENLNSGGAFKIRPDQLIFTTEHNFLVFTPSQVLRESAPPDVTITGIHVMGRRQSTDSILSMPKLELDHQNNSISIEYASMNFLGQNQLTYYHMLEGIDQDWVRTTEHRAIYNYLPYRNFVFKVKCTNADGLESTHTTTLLIQVKPPFWRSYWFMGMMVFLAIGFLYWLDRVRMQRLRATESIRTKIATSLTEDMSNTLSSINISSELAKTKVDHDAGRTREYINHISETSNRMVQSLYDMVWSINPHNDQLHKMLDRMKLHLQEQEHLSGIHMGFEADPEINEQESDMQHRYELLSIFKEAVGNAIKHANARHIFVQLRHRKGTLILEVQDDGKGFDLEQTGLGRGLNDMRRRAAIINGRLEISTSPMNGTYIRLEMPLRT